MPNELAQTEAPAAPVAATPEPAAPVAAPVAPVTTAPEIPVADQLVNLTPEGRRGLLFGQKPEPAPAAPVTPAEAVPVVDTPAVPVAEVVPPVVPPVEPADDAIDPATGFTKNFRMVAVDAKHSAFLKAYKAIISVNPNASVSEILRSVGLDAAPAGTQPAAQTIPGLVEAPQVPAEITNARAEIAAMEAQIDEAVSNGELLTPTIAKLQRDYAAKMSALAKIELRHELATERQAESAANQAHTTRQTEMQAVETAFPALTDPDSALSRELDRQFFAITANPDHPDFQKVNAQGFPAYLTEQAAKEVTRIMLKQNPGMTEAQAAAAVKGKATPAAAPVSPALVAAPARQTQTTPVPRTVLVTAPGGNAAPAPVTLNIEQIREAAANDPALRRRALGFSDNRVVA